VVVNAATGIEHGTARLMDYAKARRLCRLLVVNKIEHEGIDLASLVEQLRETFGTNACRSTCRRRRRTRVVDCFFNPAARRTSRAWPRRTSASSTRWSRSTKR
jgi:elongation factor G